MYILCIDGAVELILKFQLPPDYLSHFPQAPSFSLHLSRTSRDELFTTFMLSFNGAGTGRCDRFFLILTCIYLHSGVGRGHLNPSFTSNSELLYEERA